MNILCTTWQAHGHIQTVLGILIEARKRGHRVSYSTILPTPDSAIFKAHGIKVVSLHVNMPDVAIPDFIALQNDVEAFRKFAADLDPFELLIPGAERLVRLCKPDVMLYDATHWFSVIAAARAKIPYAGVPQGWPLVVSGRTRGNDLDAFRSAGPGRDAVFRRFGVQPHEFVQSNCLSPSLNILATTRELVDSMGAPAVRPSFLLSGPIDCEGEGESLPADFPEGRFLYFTFGTQLPLENAVFEVVREVCKSLSLPCVASAGKRGAETPPRGDGLHVYDWLPQHLALKRASVVVFHGGMNTFGECCRYEVPMLIHPLQHDQFDTAICAVRSGVGQVLSTVPSLMTGQIEALLQPDAAERSRLARIGASFRRADGSKASVDALEDLVNRAGSARLDP